MKGHNVVDETSDPFIDPSTGLYIPQKPIRVGQDEYERFMKNRYTPGI